MPQKVSTSRRSIARRIAGALWYPRDCQVCYLCEDGCPTHSISLSHDISNLRRYSTYDEFGLDV
jgi:ferredoxin